MTCRQFSLGRTILESVKVFLQAVSQAENQKTRTNPKKENTASIGYKLAGLPLGKRGIFPRDLGRSDRVTRVDSPANASAAGSLHRIQTHTTWAPNQDCTRPKETGAPQVQPQLLVHLQPPVVRPLPHQGQVTCPHTPVPGTVPKPLSSPSHPHSIPDCFPPPAPFVP